MFLTPLDLVHLVLGGLAIVMLWSTLLPAPELDGVSLHNDVDTLGQAAESSFTQDSLFDKPYVQSREKIETAITASCRALGIDRSHWPKGRFAADSSATLLH